MNRSRKILHRRIILVVVLNCIIANNIAIASGFIAGTTVLTPDGFVPIEKLKEGDKVLCRDAFGCKDVWGVDPFSFVVVNDDGDIEATIGETRKYTTQKTIRVCIDDDGTVLEGAADHKILTSRGWQKIDDLEEPHDCYTYGDQLQKDYFELLYARKQDYKNRKSLFVRNPELYVHTKEVIHKEAEVYDLYVKYHHNYIVTEKKINAHNFFPLIIISIQWGLGALAASVAVYFAPVIITTVAAHILTNKQARKWADQHGWGEDKNPPKSILKDVSGHGHPPIFKDPKGNRWISPDKDGHKGGVWKEFDRNGRTGTLDGELKPVGK